MTNRIIKIATRKSPLAIWQAEFVRDALLDLYPDLQIELVRMSTQGDKILDVPLAKVGGKGLFVKELEQGMLVGDADIAVHSMKDVPMEFPEGLGLSVICQREDYRDAFVSNKFETFESLPEGAVIGSSSLRRQCQLRARRPDIVIKDLRGNVNTRLRKLDEGQYDAIILASAGLIRLGMKERIKQALASELCLPAGGQGAVGIETRLKDSRVIALVEALSHEATTICVTAERAMNTKLNGGCQVPIACLAELNGNKLYLRGLVGDVDGNKTLKSEVNGLPSEAEALGITVAEELLAQGAGDILDAVHAAAADS